MNLMYPTDLAAKTLKKGKSWLPESVWRNIVLAYAHAVYGERTASVNTLDLVRIEAIVSAYLSDTHDLAREAVESELEAALT